MVSAALLKFWHPLESSYDADPIMTAKPVVRKEQK
jgi:hypothetical protein